MTRQQTFRNALVGTLAAVLVAACASPPGPSGGSVAIPTLSAPTAAPSIAVAASPRPIIIDADFDHSDLAAMMVLLRDPSVDVRAITISGTGLVHCQGGRLVARYLIDEFGVPDIPFGCGREQGGPDARPFPDDWRVTADGGYGLDISPQVEAGTPRDAVEVLRTAIADSPSPPLFVTLGPLTNVEDAFSADPTLPGRIAGIHAMLGTIEAPGNVFVDGFSGIDPLEWNAFADPSAVETVLATDVPVTLIPLDATDDVPVPADLAGRLDADHAAAGADLMYELLRRNPSRMDGGQGQQLWDELAALTVSDPELVTWADANVTVGAGGRLTRDDAGRPVRYASAADRPAVETALLAALRRGGPRATPFTVAGTIAVTWDGTTCRASIDSQGPGVHTLTFDGPAGMPTGVMVGGVRSPATWADLVDFVTSIDLDALDGTKLPAWLIQGPQAIDAAGTGSSVTSTAGLEPATYGPVCFAATWPNLTFTTGEPFAIGG